MHANSHLFLSQISWLYIKKCQKYIFVKFIEMYLWMLFSFPSSFLKTLWLSNSLNSPNLSNSLNSQTSKLIQHTSKNLPSTFNQLKSSTSNSHLVYFWFLYLFFISIYIYRNWALDYLIGSLNMLFKSVIYLIGSLNDQCIFWDVGLDYIYVILVLFELQYITKMHPQICSTFFQKLEMHTCGWHIHFCG